MTTNNPNRGLATDQQGRLPTDDRSVNNLPAGVDDEGVKDNDREKKTGKSHPRPPVAYGRMIVGLPPPVRNLQAPPRRVAAAADVAVTGKIVDQITRVAKADDDVAVQGRGRAGASGSPGAADYQLPDPIPCPFCWAKFLPREKFWEVDLFVR